MIKSVKVTPLYEEWENLGLKQVTGLDINIECDANDANEIFNLIEKIADRRDSTESEEEIKKNDSVRKCNSCV